MDIGVKYSEKQERNFDDATMKAGQCVIGLQVGTTPDGSRPKVNLWVTTFVGLKEPFTGVAYEIFTL